MSGIAAILHTDGRPADASGIAAMTSSMHYRASDGTDRWIHGPIALGHCAFHTSAEDRDARQPLSAAEGRFAIALDGYLANYSELRSDLSGRGVALRNRSDAELILQAYLLWGQQCLDRLEGEFAFIVADGAEQKLFCAVDQTGLRQLHYHWDGSVFIAATDIAGVLAALPETPRANLPYLAEHVANEWYSQDETVWQGVMKLPKAHCLQVSAQGLSLREYWQLPTGIAIRYSSDAEYFEHYRTMLGECVAACARTDSPLGCEVSGGLDSSGIFCLADRMAKAGNLPAPDLRGFTLAAPPGTPADEAEYVAAVERLTGRPITAVDLFCPDIEWFVQQGIADRRLPFLPNTVMLRQLAETTAQSGCRVNLTGQGGDQWLDGLVHHYRQALQMGDWRAFAQNFRTDWASLGPRWTISQALRQSLVAVLPDALHKRFREWRTAREPVASGAHLLTPALQAELARRGARYQDKLSHASADDQIKLGKLSHPFTLMAMDMVNLQAAQVGLENRNPMLSRKFITFSATTPEHIRRRGGTFKYVHREALRDILPRKIADRETKAHFSQTFTMQFQAIEEFCRDRRENASLATLLDVDEMMQVFVKIEGLKIDKMPIWTVWGTFASAALLGALEHFPRSERL